MRDGSSWRYNKVAAMRLTRHRTEQGPICAVDGLALPAGLSLSNLLAMRREEMLEALRGGDPVVGELMPPCDEDHEIWASGVTYLRSRQEREAESTVADVYARVYDAERPELFFKSTGRRAVGHGEAIRIRRDSDWNVPEPELTLVMNREGEVVGYTAGNDVSSRSIEGENPLYLPQAKCYDGACALGPAIVLTEPKDVPIVLKIKRGGETAFRGDTSTSAMRRTFKELAAYLYRELEFPNGAFLMTGTGIVPPYPFTLESGDAVHIRVGDLELVNRVA